jgi:hypothetical protein
MKVVLDGKAWTFMEQMTDPINIQPSTLASKGSTEKYWYQIQIKKYKLHVDL